MLRDGLRHAPSRLDAQMNAKGSIQEKNARSRSIGFVSFAFRECSGVQFSGLFFTTIWLGSHRRAGVDLTWPPSDECVTTRVLQF
jgi:hypothetical protein